MFVPHLGSVLMLTEDWTFNWRSDHRNYSIQMALGYEYGHGNFEYRPTLPAGTVIKVDRIYIRKGARAYDSITFRIVDSPDKRFVTKAKKGTAPEAVRFFASVTDVNTMKVELIDDQIKP